MFLTRVASIVGVVSTMTGAVLLVAATVYASDNRASADQKEKSTRASLATALGGTWDADIHTRDNQPWHETLILDNKPYEIVYGKSFGFASEQFRLGNTGRPSACQGYWKITPANRSGSIGRFVIRIEGGDTTSGRACGHEQ